MSHFPIDTLLPAIANSLAHNRCVVLQAPPGTGKTTRVPPYLLQAPWLAHQKILVLEPRRLAARSAATFIAHQLNQKVGGIVGYQMRLERKISAHTRLEFITEGLLTQRLLANPELPGVGLIIFDEFHERSLALDTGLALALDIRRALRPDLRLLVMSATIQPQAIAAYLESADIHTATARQFPVTTQWQRHPTQAPLPQQVAQTICHALQYNHGSILAFLPGEGEIRQTAELLQATRLPANVAIYPLYSALPRAAQEAAVAAPHIDHRKVVLATSIAETSLTIEGIEVVVDCGWARTQRFSPRHGMPRMETHRISLDRAAQRRGRAGRLSAGICYRLWEETLETQMAAEATPEILEADLTTTALQLADWGSAAADSIPWFTLPPQATWQRALTLLQELNALDDHGKITPHGRQMVTLPLHPRLAHMVVAAASHGVAHQALFLAITLDEAATSALARGHSDIEILLAQLRQTNTPVARRIQQLLQRWSRRYPPDRSPALSHGLLLAWAFPDRIAKRRHIPGQFLLRNGRGATLPEHDPLARAEWLVAAELQDAATSAKIRLAATLTEAEVLEHFGAQSTTHDTIYWDESQASVQALQRTSLGAITLSERRLPNPDASAVLAALFSGLRQKGLTQLHWTPKALALRQRVDFLHNVAPELGWPACTLATLENTLDEWLAPFCHKITTWQQLQKVDLALALSTYFQGLGLSFHQLSELAPTHFVVPSGSAIKLNYDQTPPYLKVRLQELFGLQATPHIAAGRVPLTLHILSPAQRPVQITNDLPSFWRQGYALVRKDLRGRYPKHYWPEDPCQAIPTRRLRPPN